MIDARWHRAATLAFTLGIAGCAQPIGPVFGEWQGQPPGRAQDNSKFVDLVLDGAPDAQSGSYRIATTENDPSVFNNHGTRRWGGTWTRSTRMVGGRELTVVTLRDHLPDDIGEYYLAPDGTLHALDPNGKVDVSRGDALYTLFPVQPRL